MKRTRLTALLLAGALAAMTPLSALASTAPCTPISNTAYVTYSVGGFDQTSVALGGPKPSTTETFNVGIKVIVTVANFDADEITAIPGTGKSALKFTVTNTGNAVHDYELTALPAASGTASPHGGLNDSFDGTTIAIYPDTNSNNVFDVGVDDAATISSLDNVGADGGSKVAFIVYSPTDLAESNLETAVYYLVATSKWADNSSITYGSGTPTAVQAGGVCTGGITVDVVAGDDDGPGDDGIDNDTNHDGQHSDDGAYQVSTAALTITKDSNIIWDPINYNNSPKAIPGALVEYVVTITNAVGAASATLSTITDNLTTNLQIDPNLKVAGAGVTIAALANGAGGAGFGFKVVQPGGRTDPDTKYYTTTSTADGVDHNNTNPGGTLSANMATVLPLDGTWGAGELKAGESVTLTFNAIIQ